jgi:hypothetical protein
MSTTPLPPFQVGQVIYLIPTGERRVMPAQITEEILRRTIGGTETVWMIQLAGSPKSVPLDPDAAEYFINVDELRRTLVERTTQQVNSMIDKTVSLAAEIFQQQAPVNLSSTFDVEDDLPQTATVTLPDGTKARVKV